MSGVDGNFNPNKLSDQDMNTIGGKLQSRQFNVEAEGGQTVITVKLGNAWAKERPEVKLTYNQAKQILGEHVKGWREKVNGQWLSGEPVVKHFYQRFDQDIRTKTIYANLRDGSFHAVKSDEKQWRGFRRRSKITIEVPDAVGQTVKMTYQEAKAALSPSYHREGSHSTMINFKARVRSQVAPEVVGSATRVMRSSGSVLHGANN